MDTPWASARTVMAVASALVAIQQVNSVPSPVHRVGFAKREPAATSRTAPDKSSLEQLFNQFNRSCQRIVLETWHWFRAWSQGGHERPGGQALWGRLVTGTGALARGCFTILVLKYLEKRLDRTLRVFPGSLTGLVLLVGALGALERLGWSRLRTQLEQFCAPALTFLAEWMPLFFAPPLVALPARLYTGGISKQELGAIAGVLFSGFVTGLVASAWATRALLRWQAREHPSEEEVSDATTTSTSNTSGVRSATVQDWVIFGLSTALAILCVLRAGARRDRLLLALVTALSYRLGTRAVPQRWQRILHPVLTCAAMTAIVTSQVELSSQALGTDVSRASWYHRLERYPTLAGNWFMQLLGPSLMALAFRLYRARALLGRHLLPLCGGSGFAAVFSLLWTRLAGRALGLKTPALRRALLPRSITMPLAIASANRLRADTGITVASVLISGILGASLGSTILNLGPETPAVARGVALGGVSHGLGTAALAAAGESTAASAAVIALGLVGAITTSLLSSPVASWIAS